MHPEIQDWSIVVAGQWNTAIFSPQWVGQRLKDLFECRHIQVEFAAGQRGTQIKLSTDQFSVIPEQSALVVAMKRIDDESLQRAERLIDDILTLLPHTPVRAFGINFAFSDSTLSPEMANLFRLGDSELLAEKDYKQTSLSIERSLDFGDAKLNVTLTTSDENPIFIRLNFHHDVNDASEACSRLRGRILVHKAKGLIFLQEIYGLTLKETP
ncbi:MAG: hypothetical protein V2B18_24435 [Pseudomonadota bacterium]